MNLCMSLIFRLVSICNFQVSWLSADEIVRLQGLKREIIQIAGGGKLTPCVKP